jgi:2-dehydropantoate 2-reductase
MRILIVGGGGLGTVFAGFLAQSGSDVSLLVRPYQAAQFTTNAVQIEGAVRFAAPVQVLTEPPPAATYDYLILCVKARDTDAALAPLRNFRIGGVLSLQNGAGKDEALARHFGAEHVIGGLTYVAATLMRPGLARATNPAGTYLGELDGRTSVRVDRLAEALNAAGLPALQTGEIVTLEWYKLAIFLRTALVSAITRLDVGALALHAPLRSVCAAVAAEVVRVAAAEGYLVPRHASEDFSLAGTAPPGMPAAAIDASEDELAAVLDSVGRALRSAGRSFYPSLAQDVMTGRPNELEATAGDVLARAERHGLAVPVLRTCTNLLRGLEAPASG